MNRYSIRYKPQAAREIEKLPPDVRPGVIQAAEALGAEPRPPGCKKLKGPLAYWRIRVGRYRVIYLIDDGVRIVSIARAVHRRDAYRS